MNIGRGLFFDLGVGLTLIGATVLAWPMVSDIQDMKQPRYEPGTHLGAAYCGECHVEIYQQWSTNSRHALATRSEGFLNFRDKFTASFMYDSMMGEGMCYACHGPKSVDEGVNCETCHGPAIAQETPDETFKVSHANTYTPAMAEMRSKSFCAKCHELQNPMSGASLLSVYSDWQKSPAAQKGITCQGCHMKPDKSGDAYHGFDTVLRKVSSYEGDVDVESVGLDFPSLTMTIINRVQGHAIPASGPSKALGLRVDLIDKNGTIIHSVTERFAKVFSLTPVIGIMPWKPVENTQLQSGESRKLTYVLPDTLKGRLDRVALTLRFYEISDEFQGDLTKAHWISMPIFEKTVPF